MTPASKMWTRGTASSRSPGRLAAGLPSNRSFEPRSFEPRTFEPRSFEPRVIAPPVRTAVAIAAVFGCACQERVAFDAPEAVAWLAVLARSADRAEVVRADEVALVSPLAARGGGVLRAHLEPGRTLLLGYTAAQIAEAGAPDTSEPLAVVAGCAPRLEAPYWVGEADEDQQVVTRRVSLPPLGAAWVRPDRCSLDGTAALARLRCDDGRACDAPVEVHGCCVEADLTSCDLPRAEGLIAEPAALSLEPAGCAASAHGPPLSARFSCPAACELELYPGADWACDGGACSLEGCRAPRADCDRDPVNGCEVDLDRSPDHCGACGRACPHGFRCEAGSCACEGAPASTPRGCAPCRPETWPAPVGAISISPGDRAPLDLDGDGARLVFTSSGVAHLAAGGVAAAPIEVAGRGAAPDAPLAGARISGDGGTVVFASSAGNLVAPATLRLLGREAGPELTTIVRRDGLGRLTLLHRDAASGAIELLHCPDSSCAGAPEIRRVAPAGSFAALAIDLLDRAWVVFSDLAQDSLQIAACDDPSCSAITNVTVAGAGAGAAAAAATAGGVAVAHAPASGGLTLLGCLGTGCEAPSRTTVDAGLVAGWPALAIAPDGAALIAYQRDRRLRLARCDSGGCESQDLEIDASPGGPDAIAIAGGGAPWIAAVAPGGAATLIRCLTESCDRRESRHLAAGPVAARLGLGVLASGAPAVAYVHTAESDLRLARCADPLCSAVTTTVIARGVSPFASVAPGSPLAIAAARSELGIAVCRRDDCAGDTNGVSDVFLHEIAGGSTARLSGAPDGADGDGASSQPAVDAAGDRVVFTSAAANLVPGDTNGSSDVFTWDRALGRLDRLSVTATGAGANGPSSQPAISADGRFVAFVTRATNLAPEDQDDVEDLVLADLDRRSLSVLTAALSAPATAPAIDGDGSKVAFEAGGDVWLWTRASPDRPRSVSREAGLVSARGARLDRAGRRLVVEGEPASAPEKTGAYLIELDVAGPIAVPLTFSPACAEPPQGALHPAISGDGRRAAFAAGGSLFGPREATVFLRTLP